MRYYRFFLVFCLVLLFISACKDGPVHSSYKMIFPELPPHWNEILGEPHWRLEWIDGSGAWQEWEGSPGQEPPELTLIEEWTSPVLAFPFWPHLNLLPGMMRPAGALFPWDVQELNSALLSLGWKGGVDAVFWKNMAAADRPTSASMERLPWYFDWIRFRELLESENIGEAVRQDPWLADWNEIAAKTVLSGFDRRRIVPQKFSELIIPDMGGKWISSSPFAAPLETLPGSSILLNVRDISDTWVSCNGVLKCSNKGWLFIHTL